MARLIAAFRSPFARGPWELRGGDHRKAGKTAVSLDEIDKLLENTNPLIKPYVDKIRRMVEEYLSERKKYTTFDDNSLLTFALIDTFGALRLERAYHAIFGSQISAILFCTS
jgi:hypothetical protein